MSERVPMYIFVCAGGGGGGADDADDNNDKMKYRFGV